MELEIISIYCLCEDLFKKYGKPDHALTEMSTPEVMTTALVSAFYFSGHLQKSMTFLKEHAYIPEMLSKSRFNRRLHDIEPNVWTTFFQVLSEFFKQNHHSQEYIIDSFPVAVCDNIRISRCKIYSQRDLYRGYIASKKRYFYGLRVHMLVTTDGKPVELLMAPGKYDDKTVFKAFDLDIPQGAVIYQDRGYTDYASEDFLASVGITLKPLRKKNAKRSIPPWERFLRAYRRKRVETSFSSINRFLPKSIHAVTPKGFELKVLIFILAFAISWIL